MTAEAGLPAISIVSASMVILPSAKLVKSTPSTDQAPFTTVAVRTITLVVLSEIRILPFDHPQHFARNQRIWQIGFETVENTITWHHPALAVILASVSLTMVSVAVAVPAISTVRSEQVQVLLAK
ncbi:hypothetical protein O9992_20340 [Vibrio lentus]|nr:hypothetical protein [Vibrio lentus]